MTRLRSRIESMVVAALVGWWAPLLGPLALYAIGRYLGWWVVGAMVVAAGGWLWHAARRFPAGMMPW